MKYMISEGNSKRVYILFHGTGGNEHDLIKLSKHIDFDATHIGLKGNVSESGMNRFFKRIRPGVFDLENLVEETHHIKAFITSLLKEKGMEGYDIHAIGYSNGANMIASLTFHYPHLFKHVYLFHPMRPFTHFDYPNLSNLKVFIAASKEDPIVSTEETLALVDIYVKHEATIEVFWSNQGHHISSDAIITAHQHMLKAVNI
jgi:phospholipase/carboxylesterase